ncbi:MAG TPA: mechanosensitive ion channel domain-containing protein [Fluviicola sp.]|nr:mechanosensitive ion channel domain-containing protein [Fluviicola sp.]
MKEFIIDWIRNFYIHKNVAGEWYLDKATFKEQAPYWALGLFVATFLLSFIMWWVARQVLLRGLNLIADRSSTTWDDHLINNKVFRAIAFLLPLTFMEHFFSIVFYQYPTWNTVANRALDVMIILVILVSINRTLNAFRDILQEKETYRDKPIQSYFQITKIAITGIFVILILARVTNQSPLFFLTSLGAMTAILVLVFKDTILGFVGSIQLAANDMIRIGDWVTMDKYGADGTVQEINLATVKVQNFDKTITTIPTYAFISDSFINWRGMQESDGRRIKRSIFIQIDTIHFASDELLKKLSSIKVLEEYIKTTQERIEAYNKEHGFDVDESINARRQTNIGLFRMYVEKYLANHPEVNQDMPLISRQLAPTPNGVPLEVYCFTKDKEWNGYERVMGDIFDHLFATVEAFELELFENPSGRDVRQLVGKMTN